MLGREQYEIAWVHTIFAGRLNLPYIGKPSVLECSAGEFEFLQRRTAQGSELISRSVEME